MRNILLVEDDDMLREAYKLILSTEPYELYLAANGKQALLACRKQQFDLILLDLMMPVMDGVGFLTVLSEQGVTLPKTVILSNLSSGDELNKALSLGAHASILKSDLSPRQLLAMVRYQLGYGFTSDPK